MSKEQCTCWIEPGTLNCPVCSKIELHKTARIREMVSNLEKSMACNCNLDNWEPEVDTGHSWVCRIHQEAKAREQKLEREGK